MLLQFAVLVLLSPPSGIEPPTLRLPGDARPLRQAVELSLDPDREAMSGTIEIELEIVRPTRIVWLNARGLKIVEASLGPPESLQAASVVPAGEDFVGL
ncbi:MAG TPA: hypothetical protein VFM88_03980, partial [Vicinamibacteria bacterium]|nr:hypothetical protein [Vicinamibacteria bacterium]